MRSERADTILVEDITLATVVNDIVRVEQQSSPEDKFLGHKIRDRVAETIVKQLNKEDSDLNRIGFWTDETRALYDNKNKTTDFFDALVTFLKTDYSSMRKSNAKEIYYTLDDKLKSKIINKILTQLAIEGPFIEAAKSVCAEIDSLNSSDELDESKAAPRKILSANQIRDMFISNSRRYRAEVIKKHNESRDHSDASERLTLASFSFL